MARPSEERVKIFELAQLNVFTPDVKKGGAGHWRFIAMGWQAMGLGGMECVGSTWTRTATWSGIVGIGGFDPSAANRGAYAGLVHGIASRPKPKPKAPPTPGLPSPRPWGQTPPAPIGKARYAECVLVLI